MEVKLFENFIKSSTIKIGSCAFKDFVTRTGLNYPLNYVSLLSCVEKPCVKAGSVVAFAALLWLASLVVGVASGWRPRK